MADGGAGAHWVDDQIHALLGYSERALCDWVEALARRTRSSDHLKAELVNGGFPDNDASSAFASRLHARAGGQGPSTSSAARPQAPAAAAAAATPASSEYKRRELEARAMAERNATSYALVDAGGGSADAGGPSSEGGGGRRHRHRHRRMRRGDDGGGEEGVTFRAPDKRQRADDEGQAKTEADVEVDERTRDQREKEEFEERLRARDDVRTRRLAESRADPNSREARAAASEAERTAVLPSLREVSRQEYLKKRETRKLQELKDEIEDELYLFKGVQLTAKEQKEYEYKKRVLALANERIAEIDKIQQEGYRMPEAYDAPGEEAEGRARRMQAAEARYADPQAEEGANIFSEQDAWEAHQSAHARLASGSVGGNFGAKDDKQYDFVFEDQVEFIKEDLMAGTMDALEEAEESEADREAKRRALEHKSERERMRLNRESLPIFPYRESLLTAIEEYQILIIVGETGSGKSTQIPQYLHESGFTKLGKIGW